MTNESAIEYLKSMKWIYQNDDACVFSNAQLALQALDMAVEALESQERQELIAGSYLLEEPSCSEKQINMAIGAITHMLSIGYYSEDMEDALYLAIKVLAETELSCSEKPNRSEPLTDKEQRIFLAAMGREEEVCKEVDEECRDCREPYEDSLVRICHEITRKVKGALWDGK